MEFSFASPQFLWLSFLAVPLVLLSIWARRRRRINVGSLVIWRLVLERNPQKKINPLKSIEILAVLLFPVFAAVSLAGPQITQSGNGSVVVIVDDSSSMATSGTSGLSRLKHAEAIFERIRGKYPQAKAVALSSGETLFPQAANVLLTKESIVKHFEAIVKANMPASFVWISDQPLPVKSRNSVQAIVGENGENIALLGINSTYAGNFAVVGNFSKKEQDFLLRWKGKSNSSWIGEKKVSLASEEIKAVEIPFDILQWRNSGGRLEVQIDTDNDGLVYDNSLVITRPVSVAIDRKRFPFMALAFEKAAGMEIMPFDDASKADILVTDHAPSRFMGTAVILINPNSSALGMVMENGSSTINGCYVTESGRQNGFPVACAEGLGTFQLPLAIVPGEVLISVSGNKSIPFLAAWDYSGFRKQFKVFYLAALPDQWVRSRAFPLTVLIMCRMLRSDSGSIYERMAESDNRLFTHSTFNLPEFNGNYEKKVYNLSLYTMLAVFLCLLYIFCLNLKQMSKISKNTGNLG